MSAEKHSTGGLLDSATKALIAKYDRPVPRYTSFPTAVQFTENFAQEDYAALLSALPANAPVSLYVHIPFCHSLCHYCGCHTKIVQTYAPIAQYCETVLEEIALTGKAIGTKPRVSQIHFGGGSPNYANPADLARILERFSAHFTITPETRIDMECDPRLLTPEIIAALSNMGVTRISLGIQDFNETVQRAINRVQPFAHVQSCVTTLRAHGITDLNFDLILGLPEQTLETVAETLARVLALAPSRIAVFPYAHVPWMKKHQLLLERYPLPDAQTRFAMNSFVHDTLTRGGYNAIGIDHYARESDSLFHVKQSGTMKRNFQGYTDDPTDTILGFGLSAITQLAGAYAQNTTDAPAYRAALAQGHFPITRGYRLSPEDHIRRDLIMTLMCDFTIDFGDYPTIPVPHAALAPLVQDGLVTLTLDTLTITETGKPFTRVVAACFDPYLKQDTTHHAKAI